MKKILTIIGVIICGACIFYLQFNYEKKYSPKTYYQVYLDEEIIGTIKSKEDFDEYVSKQGELIKNQVIEYKEDVETLNVVDEIIETEIRKSATKQQYLTYRSNYQKLAKYVSIDGFFNQEDREMVVELLSLFPTDYTMGLIVNENNISNYDTFLNKLDDYIQEIKKQYMDYINYNVSRSYESENTKSIILSESQIYYLNLYNTTDIKDTTYSKQVYMTQYIEENEVYIYASNIYTPLGVNIKKINTYSAEISTVEEVYNNIISKKSCTIEGYQFRIKKTPKQILSIYTVSGALFLDDYNKLMSINDEDILIYVTEPEIFEEAIDRLEYVFVDTELLDSYKNNTQKEIETVGSKLLDVYVEEEITIKETNIPITEKIYNDSEELSSYLLYGENPDVKTVKVSAEDNITSVSYKHGISVEEFFLSNPEFTSENNLFYEGQEVVIAKTDPNISIAVEQYIVEDMEVEYEVVEQYDNSINQGMEVVKQKGQDGVERVGQNVRSVNGTITYVEPISNVTIKSPKNKIIAIGTKIIPNVGSLSSWLWPTKKGYRISSYFGYRRSPITGGRELHAGIDIAGTGLGSPVYASNNGTIMTMTYVYSYGNYIIIDHNNGYYSTYAHMNGFAKGLKVGSTVSRGQVIGYVGSTGYSTGPHLHFEIRTCPRYSCVVNPLPYLRK